jgi:hypothetical protein
LEWRSQNRNYRLNVEHFSGLIYGELYVRRFESTLGEWRHFTTATTLSDPTTTEWKSKSIWGFRRVKLARGGVGFSIPHWFLAACSLGLAALFAFNRTAALLGLGVYLIH